jgi:hypothetical protein
MKRFPILAVVVALMLMAAACSSSDDSGDEVDEVAAQTTTTTEAGDDDSGGDVDDNGDSGDIASGLGILSDEECFQAAQAMASAFSGGIGATVEPGDIADAFDQLGAAAPSEIADDLSFVGDTLSDFYGELEDAGVDFNDPNSFSDADVGQAIIEAGESLDTDAFNEALDNVDAWFNENCDSS